MWSFRIAPLAWLAASWLASSVALNTNSTFNGTAGVLFVSPAADIAFALNIPSDSSTDLYFSIMIPSQTTWGAIGLGSNTMQHALMLMAYSSSSGNNVTLSPRLSTGHTEPVYSSDIKIEALDGTGLINETIYVFNGRCKNCRSWNGGSIDVTSTSQNFVYGTGPDGQIDSDDFGAPLRFHVNYGSFQANMIQATGLGAVPVIPILSEVTLIGTTQEFSELNKIDSMGTAHAVIMIFCFVGLFPLGILFLRIGSMVRGHAIIQGMALLLVVAGSGLGIAMSFEYNRSKNFTDPHQIIGLLVLIFVIGQFVLGYMHHRIFKKTEKTTNFAPIHVWLGRLTIILGVAAAFLGFRLALNPGKYLILAGLVICIFPIVAVMLITKRLIIKFFRGSQNGLASNQTGYNMEPWRQAEFQNGYEQRAASADQHNNQSIPPAGKPVMSSYAEYYRGQETQTDLGPQHSARQYV